MGRMQRAIHDAGWRGAWRECWRWGARARGTSRTTKEERRDFRLFRRILEVNLGVGIIPTIISRRHRRFIRIALAKAARVCRRGVRFPFGGVPLLAVWLAEGQLERFRREIYANGFYH